MSVPVAKRLLAVAEYYKMAEVGILTEDDRVELINGEIFEMSPISSLHASHVKRLNILFGRLLFGQVIIGVQDPVSLNAFSEPEPDISVVRLREDLYAEHHPRPTDIFLLIEVSLTTLGFDREMKLPLYATAEIPEFWIVNLEEKQVEIYRQPKNGKYLSQTTLRPGDNIFLEKFDLKIPVIEVFS